MNGVKSIIHKNCELQHSSEKPGIYSFINLMCYWSFLRWNFYRVFCLCTPGFVSSSCVVRISACHRETLRVFVGEDKVQTDLERYNGS